jgi:hypothetical protein
MLFLSSCEIFVIGGNKKPKEVIDLDQSTAVGAAMLFTKELQLDNVAGAAQLLSDDKSRLKATEQKQQYYNLARLTRILNERKISRTITDTIALDLYNVRLEFDYLKEFNFAMRKIDTLWYVMEFRQIK